MLSEIRPTKETGHLTNKTPPEITFQRYSSLISGSNMRILLRNKYSRTIAFSEASYSSGVF